MKQFIIDNNKGEYEIMLAEDDGSSEVIITKNALGSFDTACELATDLVNLAAKQAEGYAGAIEALKADNDNLRRTMEAEAADFKAEVEEATAKEVIKIFLAATIRGEDKGSDMLIERLAKYGLTESSYLTILGEVMIELGKEGDE